MWLFCEINNVYGIEPGSLYVIMITPHLIVIVKQLLLFGLECF